MEQLRLPNFSDLLDGQRYSAISISGKENKNQVFLKPMETFHCAPDDTLYKGERIDTYIQEVVDLLHYNDKAKAIFLNLEYKTPYWEGEADAKLYPTDDTIGYLTAQEKLIAFILETRTAFNYIDVVMGCTLTPELLSLLQQDKSLLEKE